MGCPILERDIERIIPNLYLGNQNAAKNKNLLNNYGIKIVISLIRTGERDKKNNSPSKYKIYKTESGRTYYHFNVRDKELTENNVKNIFNKTMELIKKHIVSEKILVHCKNGHHRSGTVIANYLINELNYNYMDAIKKIRDKRYCAVRKPKNMMMGLYKN